MNRRYSFSLGIVVIVFAAGCFIGIASMAALRIYGGV